MEADGHPAADVPVVQCWPALMTPFAHFRATSLGIQADDREAWAVTTLTRLNNIGIFGVRQFVVEVFCVNNRLQELRQPLYDAPTMRLMIGAACDALSRVHKTTDITPSVPVLYTFLKTCAHRLGWMGAQCSLWCLSYNGSLTGVNICMRCASLWWA